MIVNHDSIPIFARPRNRNPCDCKFLIRYINIVLLNLVLSFIQDQLL